KTVAIAHERRSCRRARARRPDRTVHALDIGVLPAGASQAPSADPVRSRRFALYSPRQSQRPGQEGGNGLACRLPHPWCIQLATDLEVEDEKPFLRSPQTPSRPLQGTIGRGDCRLAPSTPSTTFASKRACLSKSACRGAEPFGSCKGCRVAPFS